jgi:manganese-dependent inorganic pyrophosphatase
MSITYICGHLHPDTDSIVSALAYEDLKTGEGERVVAVRGGSLTPETSWVLKRFDMPVPPEIRDVRIQVRDLAMDHPIPIDQDAPVTEAWERMQVMNVKTLPVIDKDERLVGMLTSGDVANTDLRARLSLPIETSLKNLIRVLNADCYGYQRETFVVPMAILTYKGRLPSGTMVFCEKITAALIDAAIENHVPCLVECLDEGPTDRGLLERWGQSCMEHKLTLLSCPRDVYSAVRRAQVSIPIQGVMSQNKLIYFRDTDYLDDVREKMLTSRYRSYPVIGTDNKVVGTLSRYHLLKPTRKKIILVDHNEIGQGVRGLEQTEVLGIIDHHRLDAIQTKAPIFVRNEPVGCTATIIAEMYFEQRRDPSARIAGLMLCAILSDTVQFKSPTCTQRDIDMANRLAEIAGVEVETMGQEMFSVSDTLKDKTARDLLFVDFKEFIIGDMKVGVSQISSINIHALDAILADMPETLAEACRSERFDVMLFMATDISRVGTQMYYAGSARKDLEAAFAVDLENSSGSFFLPGVMSRKKQVIPALSEAMD